MAATIAELSPAVLKEFVSALIKQGIITDDGRDIGKSSARVNVFLFPNITGYSDYRDIVEQVIAEEENVVFYHFNSPHLLEYKPIFDAFEVKCPETIEQIVSLYNIIIDILKLSRDAYVGWSLGGVFAIEAGLQKTLGYYPTHVIILDAVSPTLKHYAIDTARNLSLFKTLYIKFQQDAQLILIRNSSTNLGQQLRIDDASFEEISGFQKLDFDKIDDLNQVSYLVSNISKFLEKQAEAAALDDKEILPINRFLDQLNIVSIHRKMLGCYIPRNNQFLPLISAITFFFSQETVELYKRHGIEVPYLGWPVSQEMPLRVDELMKINPAFMIQKTNHFTIMQKGHNALILDIFLLFIKDLTIMKVQINSAKRNTLRIYNSPGAQALTSFDQEDILLKLQVAPHPIRENNGFSSPFFTNSP